MVRCIMFSQRASNIMVRCIMVSQRASNIMVRCIMFSQRASNIMVRCIMFSQRAANISNAFQFLTTCTTSLFSYNKNLCSTDVHNLGNSQSQLQGLYCNSIAPTQKVK
jgi:hypothetical protein